MPVSEKKPFLSLIITSTSSGMYIKAPASGLPPTKISPPIVESGIGRVDTISDGLVGTPVLSPPTSGGAVGF